MIRYPRPPLIDGAPQARLRDTPATIIWQLRGILVGARHSDARRSTRALAVLTGIVILGMLGTAGYALHSAYRILTSGAPAAAMPQLLTPIAGALAALVVVPTLGMYAYQHRPTTRTYMTPERDAVLNISATRDGWRAHGHAARTIGTGEGQHLRRLVRDQLLAAAEEHDVPIYAIAATPALAQAYAVGLDRVEVQDGRVVRRPR